jgi:HD-GYP domain-containing protein (c-di-GMP phosphodiesterase class II)
MGRILLIGPERQRAVGVRSLLRQDGHQVVWIRSTDRWRLHEREVQPDLVVAATATPEGILSCHQSRTLRGFAAPLLFVQQEGDFLGEAHADERLVDRLGSPFMGDELAGRVDALIRVRRVIRRQPVPGRQTASRAETDHQPQGWAGRFASWLRPGLAEPPRPDGPYQEVAARVADWADRRDAFEPGHAGRVSSFCAMIAEGLRMGESETADLLRAAMLHDIGKVALPVDMLHQKRPLEEPQKRLIRTHPAKGAALLRALVPDDQVAQVVLCHHERPDGSGYYGKQSDAVPRAAFVLSVAEEYDAMTSTRLREPLKPDQALEILEQGKGTRHDRDSVEALADSLRPRSWGLELSPSWTGALPPGGHAKLQ